MQNEFSVEPDKGRKDYDWRGRDGGRFPGNEIGSELTTADRRALKHSSTQSYLALMVVLSVPLTVVLAWAAFLAAMLSGRGTTDIKDFTTEIKDFTLAMIGAIAGLSGAILGYYYGRGQAEREDGSARSSRRKSS